MGVTKVTQPIRLYLDEMIPVVLALILRQYGHDVLAAKEVNMFGKSDEDQLTFAVSNKRAILTFNIKDFVLIHKKWLLRVPPPPTFVRLHPHGHCEGRSPEAISFDQTGFASSKENQQGKRCPAYYKQGPKTLPLKPLALDKICYSTQRYGASV